MSEETLDSTTSMVHILESGSDEEIRMLLGGRERIRHAGVIRAGKQVPLKSCTPEEKALFDRLEAEGLPYDEVNRRLGGTPKSRQSKLTMANTDHFVLRPCDFKKPSDVDFILKEYADRDGLVRRIPVFFTVTDVDKAIPHGFTAFNGSGQIRCKSFYDGDGLLKFRYLEKAVLAPKESDWKILDSDDEDDATKACGFKVTFNGMYRVNVVGLRGIGECLVPNRSWNGMGDAVAVLKKVKRRLGRFDGLLDGKPFFELCKVQEYVMHEGKKSKQWIITLELSVDPMEIERYVEPGAVAARAGRAMQLLTGGVPVARPAAPAAASDLPAGLGEGGRVGEEIGASPAGTEGSAGAHSDRWIRLVDYLANAAVAIKLTPEQLREFIASQRGVSSIDEIAEDALVEICESVRKSIKNDPAGFAADVLVALEQG